MSNINKLKGAARLRRQIMTDIRMVLECVA